MGYLLQQSSTARPLYFFLVESADHITGLTGASPTVTICKNGGSFASPGGAVSEVANGWYKVAGNATDTATTGPLLLHATASGGDPLDDRFEVVAFNPDDGIHLGLSAVPNAAAGASSGLMINGSNSGSITLGALTVASFTNSGNDTTSGNVTVSGTTTLTGNVVYSGNFTVDGSFNVLGGLTVYDGVGFHGTSGIPGFAVIAGMQVTNAYGDAVNFHSTYSNGNAISLQPSGTGSGILGSLAALSNETVAVDGSGNITFNNTSIATAGTVTNPVAATLTASQPNYAPATSAQAAQIETNASATNVVAGQLATMLAASGGNWTFTTDALKNGPGGSGADPWAESLPGGYTGNQAGAVLARLQTSGSGNVAISAASDPSGGLYARTSGGAGIGDLTVIAYYTSDFRSGNLMNPRAQTLTAADGSWVAPMLLTSGTSYTFVYFGLAGYQTTTYQFTVN